MGKTDFEKENYKIPQMLPIREVASMTGLSYCFIRTLCLEGKIVFVRAGSKYLVNMDKFVDFLNGTEA